MSMTRGRSVDQNSSRGEGWGGLFKDESTD
jgi:hypothetical protein